MAVQKRQPNRAVEIIAGSMAKVIGAMVSEARSAEETAKIPYDSKAIAEGIRHLASKAADRRQADRLMHVADEIEGDLFRRVVSAAAPRVLNIRDAVELAGMSERSFYRIAPKVGEKAGREWRIFEEKLFEHAKSIGKEDLWRSRAEKKR